MPTAPVTVAVSLADKLDTLVGFFLIDEKPTGSKDPFGNRRSTISTIVLTLTSELRIDLNRALLESLDAFLTQFARKIGAQSKKFSALLDFDASRSVVRIRNDEFRFKAWLEELYKNHSDDGTGWIIIPREESDPALLEVAQKALDDKYETSRELRDFFADRLKVQQREAGVRHDLIDAVFALGGEDDLVRLLARVKALQSFVETDSGTNLLAGYKRAANILKKEEWEPGAINASPEPAEAALIAALEIAEPKAASAIEAERFEDAMAALASLRTPIDTFFNDVTVNDPDKDKRAARLDLLARFRDAVHRVADFSKIEG